MKGGDESGSGMNESAKEENQAVELLSRQEKGSMEEQDSVPFGYLSRIKRPVKIPGGEKVTRQNGDVVTVSYLDSFVASTRLSRSFCRSVCLSAGLFFCLSVGWSQLFRCDYASL